MQFKNIILEVKEEIATITLNRPNVLNALNWETMCEIRDALKPGNSRGAKGVILTGAGEKAFAAGADINELAERDSVSAKEFSVASQEILSFIEHYPKPVIAAVNGFCLGGGCELAMACHMRYASDKAKFGQPEVNLGLICGNGGTQRLPRLVGKGRAIELILTGNVIDAAEAYRIGLVNKVTAPADLIQSTEETLRTILSKGPIAVKLSLEAIQHGMELPLEEGIQLEANLFGLACSTEDSREGTRAFLEKRKPTFKGN